MTDLLASIEAAALARGIADEITTEHEWRLWHKAIERTVPTHGLVVPDGVVTFRGPDAELAAGARDRAMLERQLDGAKRALADSARTQADAAALKATLYELRARLRQATPEEQRDLVRLLVEPGDVVLSPCEITARVQLRAPLLNVSPDSKAA